MRRGVENRSETRIFKHFGAQVYLLKYALHQKAETSVTAGVQAAIEDS
jgi:hypothetical protein